MRLVPAIAFLSGCAAASPVTLAQRGLFSAAISSAFVSEDAASQEATGRALVERARPEIALERVLEDDLVRVLGEKDGRALSARWLLVRGRAVTRAPNLQIWFDLQVGEGARELPSLAIREPVDAAAATNEAVVRGHYGSGYRNKFCEKDELLCLIFPWWHVTKAEPNGQEFVPASAAEIAEAAPRAAALTSAFAEDCMGAGCTRYFMVRRPLDLTEPVVVRVRFTLEAGSRVGVDAVADSPSAPFGGLFPVRLTMSASNLKQVTIGQLDAGGGGGALPFYAGHFCTGFPPSWAEDGKCVIPVASRRAP